MKKLAIVILSGWLVMAAAGDGYDFIDGFSLYLDKDYKIAEMNEDTEDYFRVARQGYEDIISRIYYEQYQFQGSFKDFILVTGRALLIPGKTDISDEQITLTRAEFPSGITGFWMRLTLDKKQLLLFAVDLEQSPGAGLAMFLYAADLSKSIASQEKNIKALLDNLDLEFYDAAG